MAGPTVTMRCPTCGTDLRIALAPAPRTQWFPCPHCHAPVPVVVPREPPPLYSWEVLPGLYPPLSPPRVPKFKARRATATVLVAVAVIGAVLAGYLAYGGLSVAAPGSFAVSGTVVTQGFGGTSPAVGANVLLNGENGHTASVTTGPGGAFSFAGVPTGGVDLNVTLAGYGPVNVDAFVSNMYTAGATGIVVTLTPGNPGNVSTVAYTPFPDLESLLASVGAGVILLGLAAAVAGVAAWVTLRHDRPAVGVVGGCAGLFSPLALYFLALGDPFPLVVLGTAVGAALGAFAVGARAIEMAQTGAAPRPD
jgi:hypothetical protein